MLTEEVKIGCTLGMLQCLDRPHRLAYLLGERIEAFTRSHCGLVSDSARCQCNRRVPAAVQLGRARADALQFAAAPRSFEEARALVRNAAGARRALELHRTSRPLDPVVDFARRIVSALDLADRRR